MRRRQENESSLELLLDTMCNTFGGVMFIAITLAVLIAGRQVAPKHETQSRIEEVRRLQSEIRSIEIALQKTRDEEVRLQKEEDLLRDDSRREMISEIAVLEKKLNRVESEKMLEMQKTSVADTQKTSLVIELRKQEKILAELTATRDEKKSKLADAQTEIDALKQKIRKTAPRELTFHTLAEKKDAPYYIFLKDDKAWRVGPLSVGGQPQAEADVAMKKSDVYFFFSIYPDRGCRVLEQGKTTDSFNRWLSAIPAGRVAVFVVEPSSAPTFYELRQILKREGFFHGFVMCKKLDIFSIVMMQGVQYEY